MRRKNLKGCMGDRECVSVSERKIERARGREREKELSI